MEKQIHSVTTGTFIRAAIIIVISFILLQAIDILGAILVAIILASAIEPLVKLLMKFKLPRSAAVILIYLLFFFLILFAVYSFIPKIVNELQDVSKTFPKFIESLLISFEEKLGLLPFEEISLQFKEFVSANDFSLRNATESAIAGASRIFGGVFTFFVIIVISFYLALQEDGVAKFLKFVAPEQYEEYAVNLWRRTQKKIERWLQGQIVLGVTVGVIVYVALRLLQVEYALTLAVISGLFELVPFFGPIMAAIPGIIIALLQSPILGLFVLGLYIGVQQFENHILYPLVINKMTGVPPLIVIIALLVGAKLAGFFGILLAIPGAVVLIELLQDRDQKKHRSS